MWPSQMPNCTRIGRSRPSSARMRAIWSVLAASPARIAAGSPGARRSMRNTSTATISSTGRVASSLRAIKEIKPKKKSVLLQVPVEVAGLVEEAGDVLARGERRIEFAERHVGADLERARLDLLGELLLLRLVGLAHELGAQLEDLVVLGPAEPAGDLAARIHGGVGDRVPDVRTLPGGEEHVPAALVDRILLGAAAHQRVPVHRLQVHLEASLAHQLGGDVGQL